MTPAAASASWTASAARHRAAQPRREARPDEVQHARLLAFGFVMLFSAAVFVLGLAALERQARGLGAVARLDPRRADGGPFISFVHPDDIEATLAPCHGLRRARQRRGAHPREPLPHAGRGLPEPQLDDGRRRRRPVLRREGRHRARARRDRAARGPAADPRLRGAAPHADRQPARHPSSCSITDLASWSPSGEAISRLGFLDATCSAAAGGRAVRRGPRHVLQLCLENYHAALGASGGAFEFTSEG